MEEKWKDIEGFEDYEVSSFGEVRVKASGKVVEPFKQSGKKNGKNQYVYLKRYGEYKACSVPRLVAYAFVDNPSGAKTLRFIDGDCTNCRADNIEWAVPKSAQRKSIDDISIEYKPHPKGKPCDLTVLNILNGTWCHTNWTGHLCYFLGINLSSLPRFLAGRHKLSAVWKVVPYDDVLHKYTTLDKIYTSKFDEVV